MKQMEQTSAGDERPAFRASDAGTESGKGRKLGVIGAMQMEVDAIVSAMTDVVRETCGGISFVSGRIGRTEVVSAVCGVGKVYAAMCAQAMIIRYAPDFIVNTGVGGTLTRRLSIGDVAVSSSVVQYDMDGTALGDPLGWIGGLEQVFLPADESLSRTVCGILSDMGVHCERGVIATGDRFVADGPEKERISDLFSAIVCEMEGAAVGQVAAVNGIPFCVVRAVSDGADSGAVEDFPSFAAKAAKTSARAVITLARELS